MMYNNKAPSEDTHGYCLNKDLSAYRMGFQLCGGLNRALVEKHIKDFVSW